MKDEKITRCNRLYHYMYQQYTHYGIAPTIRQIALDLGYRSLSVVATDKQVLVEWGWIKCDFKRAKAIQFLRPTENIFQIRIDWQHDTYFRRQGKCFVCDDIRPLRDRMCSQCRREWKEIVAS